MSASDELSISFVSPGQVLAASILLPAIGIIVVALRLHLRVRQQHGIGLDDWLILASLPLLIGMGIALVYGVAKHSIAYPTPQLPNASVETQLFDIVPEQRLVELIDWIIWTLMIPGNGLIKLSTLLFYRRIFVVNRRAGFDLILIVSFIVCLLWAVAFLFATIFGCGVHVDYAWAPLGILGSCNTNARLDGMMISDLVTDLWVWILPLPVLWSLKMSLGKKISATAVLLLASISLAAAIVRLIVQLQISNGGYAAHTDVNLTLTILLYWSMIESGLALIATCLPTLYQAGVKVSLTSMASTLRSVSGGNSKHAIEVVSDRAANSDKTASAGKSWNSREFSRLRESDGASDVELVQYRQTTI